MMKHQRIYVDKCAKFIIEFCVLSHASPIHYHVVMISIWSGSVKSNSHVLQSWRKIFKRTMYFKYIYTDTGIWNYIVQNHKKTIEIHTVNNCCLKDPHYTKLLSRKNLLGSNIKKINLISKTALNIFEF